MDLLKSTSTEAAALTGRWGSTCRQERRRQHEGATGWRGCAGLRELHRLEGWRRRVDGRCRVEDQCPVEARRLVEERKSIFSSVGREINFFLPLGPTRTVLPFVLSLGITKIS
jgi:hypothetical protein